MTPYFCNRSREHYTRSFPESDTDNTWAAHTHPNYPIISRNPISSLGLFHNVHQKTKINLWPMFCCWRRPVQQHAGRGNRSLSQKTHKKDALRRTNLFFKLSTSLPAATAPGHEVRIWTGLLSWTEINRGGCTFNTRDENMCVFKRGN